MRATSGIRMRRPAHPGGFVRSEVIEPLGLSVAAAAQTLRVTRSTLCAFLGERSRLSCEMARRIDMAFGVPTDTLMRMQNSFDIAQASRREDKSHRS